MPTTFHLILKTTSLESSSASGFQIKLLFFGYFDQENICLDNENR